ncbi:cytochrome P450 [Arthrobacter sp. FB24]|uniref:cytochrome P450 n=1 Tax=Arthrobacter sp. (strain FB24) TaxID=290399 RepID=UPI00030FEE49|nr:cytochrome P450 [Arthrobacter sp. FB24]
MSAAAARDTATGGAAMWERRLHTAAHPVAYPLIRGLGKLRHVVRLPGLGVLVSEASLVREVLMDASYSKSGARASGALWTPVVGPRVLLNMHGEEHLELRRRLNGLFTPRAVQAIVAPAGERLRSRLATGLENGGSVEFVGLVKELSGGVISRLLGVRDDAPGRLPDTELFNLGTSITSLVRLGRPRLTPPQVTRAKAAVEILAGPVRSAYRSDDPSSFPGRLRVLGLSEDEAVGIVSAFVIAGTETLVSYVPRLAAMLFDDGRLPGLAADRSGLPDAVNEGLRYTAPSPMMLREATTDGQLGGVRIRPGDRILLSTVHAVKSLGGFDPRRPIPPAARQLWFGAGAHFCIGMPLAMAEINSAMAVLLDEYRRDPWRVRSRSVSRNVLIPHYKTLELARAN